MADIAYIRGSLNGMAISGLWDTYDFKNPVKRFLFYVYGKFVFIFFTCFNITEFIEMYFVKNDIMLLMQNAGVTLLYGLVVLKAYMMMFQKDRIEHILSHIRREEQRSLKRNEEEVKIFRKMMEYSWLITRIFWFICATTVLMFYVARPAEYFAFGPQAVHHYKVPLVFSSWFPFDRFAPGYYELAYTVHLISGVIGGYYVAVVDMFIVTCMTFGIAQFRMIQSAIKNLHEIPSVENDPHGILDPYLEVVDIVKHHCRITTYLEDLDKLVNFVIFMKFLICSLMICSVGLEGIMSGLTPRLAQNIYYLSAILIQLFLYYYHANEVTIQGVNIINAIGQSEWPVFSHRVKHALIMIMVRAAKPVELSIGGFYPMCLRTFLMILKASYSYLALFRQMYLRDQAFTKAAAEVGE